jgi:seryl-tRNA synthetase
MHDINWIRANPKDFVANLAKRGEKIEIDQILDLDQKRRKLIAELQSLQQTRNEKSKTIGLIKDKKSTEFEKAKESVQEINDKIHTIKTKEQQLETKLAEILNAIPNLVAEDVPVGKDEKHNVVIDKWGEPQKFSFTPRHHFELGEKLGMMDFAQTAKISGSRFVTIQSDLARLERALAHFMLDVHIKEFGFTEVSPPVMVKSNAMYGTGNLPKFGEDAFETKDGFWLVPTSEVFLTNLVAGRILDQDQLPIRYTAYTPCFRSEAGSACKDTRGMIRLHQFSKVELVTITTEEHHLSEYEHLIKAAEEILKRLELPYQKVLLCTGDTTFSATKTCDLEVWLPGQNCYREISSCSVFNQFQARRMKARYRQQGEKETQFVYTMNGSGLALGRTIVAIMENYQNEDGSINIPTILHSYMDGKTVITN